VKLNRTILRIGGEKKYNKEESSDEKASRFSMTIYWLICGNFERTPSCDKKRNL
jgi:hypothetical protein